MQQLFLIVVFCVSYFLIGSFANPVKEVSFAHNSISSLSIKRDGQVKANAISGTFPTNPTYAVGLLFSDSGCNTITSGASILLNTCLTNGTQSESYVCNGNGGFNESIYSDAACNNLIEIKTHGTGCTNTGGPADVSYEKVTGCGTSAFNYDTSKSWVVFVTYQTEECTNILDTGAVLNGECFSQAETGSSNAWLYSWPNIIEYKSPDCTGASLYSFPFSQVCTVDDDEIDYDNTVYVAASSSSNDDSLSAGAIAGIVIAVIVVLLLIAAVVYYFLWFKKSVPLAKQQQEKTSAV